MSHVTRTKFRQLEARVTHLEDVVAELLTSREYEVRIDVDSLTPEQVETASSSIADVLISRREEDPGILSFDELNLPPNVTKAFEEAGVRELHEALAMSDDELLSIKGVGKGTVKKLRSVERTEEGNA
jgi:DNA-directed RNA polymerase alpha subunit